MNDDRSLFLKIGAWALLIAFAVVLSPVLLAMLVFELTPYRRKQIFMFELATLDILRQQGETEARALRRQANTRAHTSIGSSTFYAVMSTLIDDESVTMRKVDHVLYGQPVTQTLYTLTPKGRRRKIELESMRAAATRAIGSLLPLPA